MKLAMLDQHPFLIDSPTTGRSITNQPSILAALKATQDHTGNWDRHNHLQQHNWRRRFKTLIKSLQSV